MSASLLPLVEGWWVLVDLGEEEKEKKAREKEEEERDREAREGREACWCVPEKK